MIDFHAMFGAVSALAAPWNPAVAVSPLVACAAGFIVFRMIQMSDEQSEGAPVAVQRLAFPVTIVASLLVPLIIAVLWMAAQFHEIDKRLTRIEDNTAKVNDHLGVSKVEMELWIQLLAATNPTFKVPPPPWERR